MKKYLAVFAVAFALAGACIGFAQSAEQETKTRPATFATSDQVKYNEVVPGVTRAVLWGNPDKGRYGAFTKFKPGMDAGMHTHTNDVWLVVIKGAYLYKDDAGEKRVGPGNFIRIPAKHKHWSGGDAKEGALFYEESSGKFDLIPAK